MQLDMVTVQGAFLYNVGASEALPARTHEVEPIVMWMGQPHARNQIQGTLPCGRQGSSMFEGCSGGSLVTPCGMEHPGRGSVVMADIQHNVWVILLS